MISRSEQAAALDIEAGRSVDSNGRPVWTVRDETAEQEGR